MDSAEIITTTTTMKTAPFFAPRRTGHRLRVRATKHLEGSQPDVWYGTRAPTKFRSHLYQAILSSGSSILRIRYTYLPVVSSGIESRLR